MKLFRDKHSPLILNEFLNFLAQDIEKNPQQIQPINSDLATRIQSLVSEVEIDLDAPLPND